MIILDPNKYSVIVPKIRSSAIGKKLNHNTVRTIETLEKIYLSIFYNNRISAYFINLCLKNTKKLYRNVLKIDNTKSYNIYSINGAIITFSFQLYNNGEDIDDNFTLYG